MIVSYSPGDSFLYRLNPLAKLSAVFAACTALFLLGTVTFDLAGLLLVVAFALVTGQRQVLRFARSRFVSFLGVWVILANALFVTEGKPLLSLSFYFFHLTITDVGLLTGIVMAARLVGILLISGLFISTTDPAALVYSLMKRGVPYRYGFMLIIMLRFVPVFEREMKTVSNAQRMRGLEIDKRNLKLIWRSIRFTFVPLIVSALSKVETLVVSMEGRAFGYQRSRTFIVQDRYAWRDKVLIFVSLSIIAVLLLDKAVGWNPLPLLGSR